MRFRLAVWNSVASLWFSALIGGDVGFEGILGVEVEWEKREVDCVLGSDFFVMDEGIVIGELGIESDIHCSIYPKCEVGEGMKHESPPHISQIGPSNESIPIVNEAIKRIDSWFPQRTEFCVWKEGWRENEASKRSQSDLGNRTQQESRAKSAKPALKAAAKITWTTPTTWAVFIVH